MEGRVMLKEGTVVPSIDTDGVSIVTGEARRTDEGVLEYNGC